MLGSFLRWMLSPCRWHKYLFPVPVWKLIQAVNLHLLWWLYLHLSLIHIWIEASTTNGSKRSTITCVQPWVRQFMVANTTPKQWNLSLIHIFPAYQKFLRLPVLASTNSGISHPRPATAAYIQPNEHSRLWKMCIRDSHRDTQSKQSISIHSKL